MKEESMEGQKERAHPVAVSGVSKVQQGLQCPVANFHQSGGFLSWMVAYCVHAQEQVLINA